jgi:hypothetical protein
MHELNTLYVSAVTTCTKRQADMNLLPVLQYAVECWNHYCFDEFAINRRQTALNAPIAAACNRSPRLGTA